MVRMCIVSDNIIKPEGINLTNVSPLLQKIDLFSHVDIFSWKSSLSIDLSSYQIVVLDQKISVQSLDTVDCLNFHLTGERIYNLLESSGIVICLTYHTSSYRFLSVYKNTRLDNLGIARPQKEVSRQELTFDWLNEDLALALGLLDTAKGIVDKKNISKLKKDLYKMYFSGVKECHKILKCDILASQDGSFFIMYRENPIEIIAEQLVTKEPVAAIIKEKKGYLVFLPQTSLKPIELIPELYTIGTEILDEKQIIESRPDWVENLVPEAEKAIYREIDDLHNEMQDKKKDLEYFKKIDYLLFGSGKNLEKSIMQLFKEVNVDYERAPQAAHYDIKVNDLIEDGTLYIEVTSLKNDRIDGHNKKITQFLYLSEDINLEKDKIVLLFNCQRYIEIDKRNTVESMITKTAIRGLKAFDVVSIYIPDLYNQWKKLKDGEIDSEAVKQWLIKQVLD